MASIQTVLGKNIKSLRTQKDWSRSFLADKLDISVSFLTMVELGQRGVSLSLVEDIASVFAVPVPYLFTDHDEQRAGDVLPAAQMAALEHELREYLGKNLDACLAEFFAGKQK